MYILVSQYFFNISPNRVYKYHSGSQKKIYISGAAVKLITITMKYIKKINVKKL